MASLKPQTKIKKATKRAGIFLSLLFMLFLASTYSAVYAGIASGELEKKVFKPIKYGFNQAKKSLSQSLKKEILSKPSPTPKNSNQIQIKIRNQIKVKTGSSSSITRQQEKIHWVPPQWPSPYDYEQAKKAQEEWWKNIQEKNRQLSEKNKKILEEFKLQTDQRLEKFKLEGEQGMVDFKERMAKEQEEFLKEKGITP